LEKKNQKGGKKEKQKRKMKTYNFLIEIELRTKKDFSNFQKMIKKNQTIFKNKIQYFTTKKTFNNLKNGK